MNIFRRSRFPNIRLNPTPRLGSKRRWWQPWLKPTAKYFGLVLGLLLIIGGVYYVKLRASIAAAYRAKDVAKSLMTNISNQQFPAAQADVAKLQTEVATIDRNLNSAQSLKLWPIIGTQYRAALSLADIGVSGVQAADPLVEFMAHLFEPFADQGKVSLSSLTPAQKGQLLAGMSTRESDLREAQTAIHQAATAFDALPKKGLIGPLKTTVASLREQFPHIVQALDQAIPATHIIPAVLGYPKEKSYLFLLENNTELRPGGGFIGTYGVMKVSSGEIVSLKTDNSYNLDDNAKKLTPIAPPPEIQKYLKQKVWYFRDSNWSPDFPTSAEQALFFYQREGGQRNIDGVIAITPTTVSALLRLVGSIKVGNETFTADTFLDQLQKYVDLQYKANGKTDSQRKDIIGVMTSELMDRLMKLPVTKWKDVFLTLSQQLNEKQFLMYMKDRAVQGLIVEQNWGGAIDRTEGSDSILIADANLASLKTDLVMARDYEYTVTPDEQGAVATLTIHYRHTGKFDWRTSWRISRYNTYVRIYVPNGSTLITAQGAQLRERSNAAGEVTTTTELGKTVFGAYKSIEPSTTSDLTLTYRLPTNVAQTLRSGTYRLAWQKEAGMTTPNMKLTLREQNSIQEVTGLDKAEKISDSALSFTGTLPQDRIITVKH